MKKTTANIVRIISAFAIFGILLFKEDFSYIISPIILTFIALMTLGLSIDFLAKKSVIGKPLYIQDWITNDIEIGTKFSLKFIGYPSNRDLNYKLFLAQTKNSLGEIDESLIVLVGHSFSDGNYRKTKTKNAWGSDVEFLSK